MIEINSRLTGNVLWSGEASTVREAVILATNAGADLADADLAGAYLAGANLADADLADADLAGADVADANLAGANLAGADLAGANLAGADLAGADLAGANLARADLAGKYSRRVRTRREHAVRFRDRHPLVPVVENLDQRILDAIALPGNVLDMGDWHTCDTTHCRAGWAVHLAGQPGYALERQLGSAERAGRAIYRASTGRSPYFFASTEDALADIKRCAAEDAEP